MGATLLLARATSRRAYWPLLALAVIVTLGLGAGLTSLEGWRAGQTHAYGEFLESARVGDVTINPGPATADAERAIRETPGVRNIVSDRLLLATVDNPKVDVKKYIEDFIQVRSSNDNRYVDRDLPAVHRGRLLGSGREAFLNLDAAEQLGLGVGDPIELSFYPASVDVTGVIGDPLARVTAEVVGVGLFHDEVVDDELFPTPRVLVTPEVAGNVACTFGNPNPNDDRSADQITLAVIPPDCSTSYQYWSLAVDGGASGAHAVADELGTRLRTLNESLPQAFLDADIRYIVIPSFRADSEERVHQSLSPVVTALAAFGVAATLATVVVTLLLAARALRRRETEARTWRALGLSARWGTAAMALPLAVSVVAGVLGALIIAWLASSAGPIAGARDVVPHPGRSVSTPVVGLAALVLLILGAGVVAAARRSATTPARAARGPARRWFPGSKPDLALGVRAATSGAGAFAVVFGAIVAVAAVTATLVFSTSLARFVVTPSRYGWPFDAAVVINGGYGDADDLGNIAATLDRADVERWGRAALSVGLEISGTTVPAIAARPGFAEVASPRVVAGRLPSAADEIGLGARTAKAIGADIGDRVEVTSSYGTRTAAVTGTIVLPTIGPLGSDRASLGTGAYLPASFFDDLVADAATEAGVPAGTLADSLSGFVALDLADGVKPETFFDELGPQIDEWDSVTTTPIPLSEPVRPATVVDVADALGVPFFLAGAVAVAMVIALFAGVASGTRARRYELAVLRAAGASRRQVRASVRWHALTIVTLALVVGLPIGIAAGRAVYRAFAEDLGAEPDAWVSPLLLLAIIVAVVLVGFLAAVPSQRSATRPTVLAALQADDRRAPR